MTEPERLRDLLEFYREGRGRGGLAFSEAWWRSVERVCRDSPDEGWWRATFAEQRDVWQRAYDRERRTSADTAIVLIAEGRVIGGPEVGHPCGFCDEEIPAARLKRRAEFCSEACRKAASWERERERRTAA